MKIKKYFKKISICAFAIFTMASCLNYKSFKNFNTYASVKEEVSVTNGNFANNPNVTYLETSPSGWSKINNSSATAGIINVNSDTFSKSTYYLDENPGKKSTYISDDKILMINSKNANANLPTNQGYKSNDINLNSNSYYEISILAKTLDSALGSIYLTGLEDYQNSASTKFEKITTNNYWNEYKFYIATDKSKTVNLELWLGSNAVENYQSSDAVFYDEIEINRISHDLFEESVSANQKTINYQNPNVVAINNANFESGNLTNWAKTENSDSNGFGKVMDISSDDTMLAYGLLPLGTDLSKNNKYGLVISNNTQSSVGYKLQTPISLLWGDYLKITANVKVSENLNGKAYVVISENNDVKDFQTNLGITLEDKLYSPVVNKLSINSNSSDKYVNNYQTVTFYIKGHNFYNSSFNVEFWLGYNDGENNETAVGYAVFDNLKVENISGEEYKNATTSTYVSKIELKTTSESESFKNGEFNNFSKNEQTLTYPYTAEDWNVVSSNSEQTVAGVININNDIYSNIKSQIGNIANPAHITTSTSDTNNVMMLWNKSAEAQSIQSSSFNVTGEKYYNLNFNYKTIATTSNNNLVNVEVLDNNNNVIYIDKNINSQTWTNYSVLIKAEKASSSLSIRISLGLENNKVSGYLFVDNVRLVETTAIDNYEEYVENNNVIDFTSGKFNLKSYEKNSHDYYTPLAYDGNLENGSQNHAIAGVIDAKENTSVSLNSNNTNALKNMLVIETFNEVTYSLISKDSISLEADKYYQFEIDIKTILENNNLEYEENYYGAEFSLVNIEDALLKAIKADDYTTYTIYIKAVASAETNLRFAMKTIDTDTSGFAFFDNYKMTEISESTYLNYQETYADDETKLFAETTEDEDDEEDEDEEKNSQFDFLLIPSIIIGLALVIAIVGSILKRIRFKKWTKKKQTEYDRNKTLHRDVIRKEAEEKRDEQVKHIKQQIKTLEEQMTALEEQNQLRLKNNRRRAGNRNIDKQTEKEFKQYAKQHTAMQKKIDLLNSEVSKMETDEYLIKLQNKLFAENLKNKLNGKANLETEPQQKEKVVKTKKQRNKELYSKKNKE